LKRSAELLFIVLTFTNVGFYQFNNAKLTLFHVLFSYFTAKFLMRNGVKNMKFPGSLILLVVYVTLLNLFNVDAIEMSSFIYFLITSSFIFFLYNFIQRINRESIEKVIKSIIVLFSCNIFIGFALIMINIIPEGFLRSIIGIYIAPTGEIRPHGFVDEPSYAAILLVFVLFVMFRLHNFTITKLNYKWYLVTVISILLTLSSYGYLFLGFFILAVIKEYISFKNILLGIIPLFFVMFSGLINVFKVSALDRLNVIFDLISDSSSFYKLVDKMKYVDGSAAMRIFPTIELVNYYQKCDIFQILFGFGSGKSEAFFPLILEQIDFINLGFIPAFVYNYGLVGFGIGIVTIYKFFPVWKFPLLLLFSLFMINADYNTQIFVAILFLVMLVKRIETIDVNIHKREKNLLGEN